MTLPLPIGTVRFHKAGGGSRRLYAMVKVGERSSFWEYLHRVVWERTHGPVPDGMVVWFKNNISTDCRPQNLELISREECCRRLRDLYADEWKEWHERCGAAGAFGLVKGRQVEMRRRERARRQKEAAVNR